MFCFLTYFMDILIQCGKTAIWCGTKLNSMVNYFSSCKRLVIRYLVCNEKNIKTYYILHDVSNAMKQTKEDGNKLFKMELCKLHNIRNSWFHWMLCFLFHLGYTVVVAYPQRPAGSTSNPWHWTPLNNPKPIKNCQ